MMVKYHQINMRWVLMMRMTKRKMIIISVRSMTILMTMMTTAIKTMVI